MKKILFVLALSGMTSTFIFAASKNEKPSAISKLLAFPVAGKRASIQSFWGAERDGGKRKHEGIDIFARKGTPAVAICDAVVTSVGNTPRGGKTVWIQSLKYGWTAYYAHLDKQMVRVGQLIRKGQAVGTVGNTGNARTTPAHLHFGIYTWLGAVNPLPYVKNATRIVVRTPAKKTVAKKSVRGQKSPGTTKPPAKKNNSKKTPVHRYAVIPKAWPLRRGGMDLVFATNGSGTQASSKVSAAGEWSGGCSSQPS